MYLSHLNGLSSLDPYRAQVPYVHPYPFMLHQQASPFPNQSFGYTDQYTLSPFPPMVTGLPVVSQYQSDFAHLYPNIQNLLDNPINPVYQNKPSLMPNQTIVTPFHANLVPPRPSILDSFKNQNGQLDINKMVNTAGQLVGVVNQVSGLIKGFTSMFKV